MQQFTIEDFAAFLSLLVLGAMVFRHIQINRAWRNLTARPGTRVDVDPGEFSSRLEVLNRESNRMIFSALSAIKIYLPPDVPQPRQNMSGSVLLPIIKGRIGFVSTASGAKGFNWCNRSAIFTILPSSWLEWACTLPNVFKVSFVGSRDAVLLVNPVSLSEKL